MATMTISLPHGLKSFVDEQAAAQGYATVSTYVCALIRREQDRHHLRGRLLSDAASAPAAPAGKPFFDRLRERVRHRKA